MTYLILRISGLHPIVLPIRPISSQTNVNCVRLMSWNWFIPQINGLDCSQTPILYLPITSRNSLVRGKGRTRCYESWMLTDGVKLWLSVRPVLFSVQFSSFEYGRLVRKCLSISIVPFLSKGTSSKTRSNNRLPDLLVGSTFP